jgi:hypothetical protein
MKTLNLDTARVLAIIVAAHNSYGVEFRLYENLGTEEKPIKGDPIDAAGVWKFIICKNSSAALVLKTYTNSDGISTSANVITLEVAKAENNLPAGEYYFFLRKEVDSELSIPVFKGPFTINAFPQ